MDFDQIETFLEVARHASFSRAAEKRFRTQPAISSQIRSLEEEVGAKLFDRSGGKVSLTAAGKAFQKYVEETLEARKAMLVALAEMERVPRGEIVVGANEGTCLHILPEVFAGFKKLYPDVSVNIKRSDYAKILESVTDNSVDFGVVSLPITDNRLTAVLIHQDELVLIAPPQHPVSKLKSVTVAEIAKFPLVVPKLGHTRDGIEQLFQERRLKPNYTMELDSSELLKRFVAADVGIGFIASSNVQEDVRAKVLVAIPIADAQIRRDLALVFRKDKALSRAALAFIVTGTMRYSPEAVIAASGLQIGAEVNDDDFKKASRRLGDTGAFTDIAYSFSYSAAGTKLELKLVDAPRFLPAHFEDFIWFSDEELQKRIRAHVPLFNGELPASGRLPDEVSDVLQAMLVEKGIPGHVDYLRAEGPSGQIEAFNYSVSNVLIRIRNIRFTGAGASELTALEAAAQRLPDREYSLSRLNLFVQRQLLPVYYARGYLKSTFGPPQPTLANEPAEEGADEPRNLTIVDVHFTVTPGQEYKLSRLEWSGNHEISTETLQSMVRLAP